MAGPFLYSVNTFIKYHIQREFRGDVHYVWCADVFDSSALNRYSGGSLIPPSSSPVELYRSLKADCERCDWHSAKISEQKASLTKRATDWYAAGELTKRQHDDILFMLSKSDFKLWRPLIYVIARHLVEGRMQEVEMARRAGVGMEYIIEDLQPTEFELIEI